MSGDQIRSLIVNTTPDLSLRKVRSMEKQCKNFRFSDTCYLPLASEYMISYRPAHPLVKIIIELKEKSTICRYCIKNTRYISEFCSSSCMFYFCNPSDDAGKSELFTEYEIDAIPEYKNVHFSYFKRLSENL